MALLVSIGLAALDPLGVERWVPEQKKVQSVSITYRAPGYYHVEETYNHPVLVDAVIDVHGAILEEDQITESERRAIPYARPSFRISYTMKDGREVIRDYYLRQDGQAYRQLQRFLSMPERILGYTDWEEYLSQIDSVSAMGEKFTGEKIRPLEDYDLAGFAVGIVDKKKILDNTRMRAGDVVIALASTGIHSNGFSLCRKVFNIDNNDPNLYIPRQELGGKTVAETLLEPTKIYVKSILALLEKVDVKGISHITGGGFYENIPRSIPNGLCAKIDKASVRVLPIFDLIAKEGNIPERDMYNTYNMGVGMSVVVPAEQVEEALSILTANGETAYVIGSIIEGEEKVILE